MQRWQIITFAIIAHLMWSSAFLFGKKALGILPPLSVAGVRLILATILMFAFVHKNPFPYLKGKWKWVLLVSFLSTYVNFSVFNLGLSLVSGSLGSMIIGASPAFTSIAAVFVLKESMSKKNIISLCIGLSGVIVLALSRTTGIVTGVSEVLGIILLMLSNTAGAISTCFVKKYFTIDDIMPFNLVQNGIGAFAVCLTALFFEKPDFDLFLNPDALISISCLATITAVASSLWNLLLTQKGLYINDILAWKFLIPSMGAVLSWLFLPDDDPNLIMILCLLLITFSILISVVELKKKPAKELAFSKHKEA